MVFLTLHRTAELPYYMFYKFRSKISRRQWTVKCWFRLGFKQTISIFFNLSVITAVEHSYNVLFFNFFKVFIKTRFK